MIDFTGSRSRQQLQGADFKRKIIYDGDVYMLKFGQKLESDEHKPLQASYTSTPVSGTSARTSTPSPVCRRNTR